MTYSKAINNNFMFSICAPRVIILINLGHDGVQFVIHLFIPLSCHKDEINGLIFIKKKRLYMGSSKFSGCASWETEMSAYLADVIDMASCYPGLTFYEYHREFSAQAVTWHTRGAFQKRMWALKSKSS